MKKAKKNSPQNEEVSGHLRKSGQGGGLQPLGAQKQRPPRPTTVPREGNTPLAAGENTTTTVPRE